MRRFGQALAIAGAILLVSPGLVPLDPVPARGVAGALFLIGLTLAVMGAVLGNLPGNARIEPLADERIPAPCLPLVEDMQALGFARLGPALRVHLEPAASLVPFWHPARETYATVFVSDGAPAQAHYDFVTLFEPGELALTSSANVGAGVLPPAPATFLQIFAGAAPEDLLRHHEEGAEHVAREAGVRPMPCCDLFEEVLARALRRQRAAFLKAPVRHTWTALLRVLRKATPALGPVSAQKHTRARLEAIAGACVDDAVAAG